MEFGFAYFSCFFTYFFQLAIPWEAISGSISHSSPHDWYFEASSGKSVLLRSILATHLLPKTCGGHGLPSVLIDADNAFDVWLLAKVLQVQHGWQSQMQNVVETTWKKNWFKNSRHKLLICQILFIHGKKPRKNNFNFLKIGTNLASPFHSCQRYPPPWSTPPGPCKTLCAGRGRCGHWGRSSRGRGGWDQAQTADVSERIRICRGFPMVSRWWQLKYFLFSPLFIDLFGVSWSNLTVAYFSTGVGSKKPPSRFVWAEDPPEFFEALGRLLLFRPAEPFELLKQLSGLRQIFAQNPTAGLLVSWLWLWG